VNPTVLDLPGVVIADKNAAADFAKFLAAPQGLTEIDGELMFREFWTDPDPYINTLNRQARQAEVLVPDSVAPLLVMGAYLSCSESQGHCGRLARNLPTLVDAHLFMLL
jgi:hypothetical protein